MSALTRPAIVSPVSALNPRCVRVESAILEELGVEHGSAIRVEAESTTIAPAWPAGSKRSNAGEESKESEQPYEVELGTLVAESLEPETVDGVNLEPANIEPIEEMVVTILDQGVGQEWFIEHPFGKLPGEEFEMVLTEQVIAEGDHIVPLEPGSPFKSLMAAGIHCHVDAIAPHDWGVVTEATEIPVTNTPEVCHNPHSKRDLPAPSAEIMNIDLSLTHKLSRQHEMSHGRKKTRTPRFGGLARSEKRF